MNMTFVEILILVIIAVYWGVLIAVVIKMFAISRDVRELKSLLLAIRETINKTNR